jgi:DNA-binding response OmpR family regulator
MSLTNKILIVDDERPLARALEIKFNKAGMQALAVFEGDQAVKELQKGEYKVLLLDLVMPGLDGWGVLAKIKELKLAVKVFITSNLGQQEDIVKAKELGATEFIVKSDATLAQIVEKVQASL